MKKFILMFSVALLALSTTSALEPIKLAILKTGTATDVQVILNDYTGGTATPKYTGPVASLSPNGSGVIIIGVANNTATTDWTDILPTSVNSYYILDIYVNQVLYAQYRLDQLIINQSLTQGLDNDGNLVPTTDGFGGVGTDEKRWGELFLSGQTLHIGPSLGAANDDELAFSYDHNTNTATMKVANKTALTAAEDFITIPQQANINGLTIGKGRGNIASNTAMGVSALNSNTTGFNNTANGNSALYSNTTGVNNTASGVNALQNNTTGYDNTATGLRALQSNTSGFNNTASGSYALLSNNTGADNTATGFRALQSNQNGLGNTATGANALQENTTGYDNTANGYRALRDNTTGSNNTANGVNALQSNISGNDNTANGFEALRFNTMGYNNTAIGYRSLRSNQTGTNNTANGVDALRENTTGDDNTANGVDALRENTTGYSNTANGTFALYSNLTGIFNTANGAAALFNNTIGYNNTANGVRALHSNTIGYNNTANGFNALRYNTTGYYNTANGNEAGNKITTGNSNVFIGYKAASSLLQKEDASNSISIGANTYTTADNQVVIGDNNITETQLRGVKFMDLAGGGTQNIQIDNTGKLVTSTTATVIISGSQPITTTEGSLWYDSVNSALKIYISGSWVTI